MTTVTNTHTIRLDVVQGASLVGQIVTVGDNQYRVHSIEGIDWYAFDQDGQVTIDQDMTPCGPADPTVTLLPAGTKIGQGFAENHKLSAVRRGVSLVKSWL